MKILFGGVVFAAVVYLGYSESFEMQRWRHQLINSELVTELKQRAGSLVDNSVDSLVDSSVEGLKGEVDTFQNEQLNELQVQLAALQVEHEALRQSVNSSENYPLESRSVPELSESPDAGFAFVGNTRPLMSDAERRAALGKLAQRMELRSVGY